MSNQKPSYTAYTVQKREGKDDFWLPIGAAFMHQDGDGFNVVLQALPVDGKVVLRVVKSEPTDDVAAGQRAIRQENDRRKARIK